jgi:transcriptional regulator with XRE-family HTH domain
MKTIRKARVSARTVREMGPPTLSQQQVKRIVDTMQTLYEQCGHNATELARRLKISQAAVSEILAGKNRPSFKTAERVAQLAGVQIWTLVGTGATPTPASHPNLMATLDLLHDRIAPEARERVLAAAVHLPDFGQSTWIAMLLDPAHGAVSHRTPPESNVREKTLPSHAPPTRTGEIQIVRKKDV